jgi:hypothetical protein
MAVRNFSLRRSQVRKRGKIDLNQSLIYIYPFPHSHSPPVAYPGIFSGGWGVGGGSTNSVEDRWQSERGFGDGSPLVRGSAQFANEWNPYSYYVITDVFSTEQGIRLSFVKTSEFRGRGWTPNPPSVRHCLPFYWPLFNSNFIRQKMYWKRALPPHPPELSLWSQRIHSYSFWDYVNCSDRYFRLLFNIQIYTDLKAKQYIAGGVWCGVCVTYFCRWVTTYRARRTKSWCLWSWAKTYMKNIQLICVIMLVLSVSRRRRLDGGDARRHGLRRLRGRCQ